MAEQTLIARVREDDEQAGTLIVSSPVVGMADGAPKANLFLNPLDQVVQIKILDQRFVLRLPRDKQGRITEVMIPNEYTPLAFNQPIVRMDPRAIQGAGATGAAGGTGAGSARTADGADVVTVKAPSEGIFYCRPSPDDPPFVEIGAEVTAGTVLGLVEVMKCFNQITYGGRELPPRGRVVKILAEDSAEVVFGQPLFQVAAVE